MDLQLVGKHRLQRGPFAPGVFRRKDREEGEVAAVVMGSDEATLPKRFGTSEGTRYFEGTSFMLLAQFLSVFARYTRLRCRIRYCGASC